MANWLPLSEQQKAFLNARVKERLANCKPWTRNIRWEPEMNIIGSTYQTLNLFPEVKASGREVYDLREGEYIDSPNRMFRYALKIHRRGHPLPTWWGPKVGTAVWDSDVEIPVLFERRNDGGPGEWNTYPWMSITPGEILTLRVGTKMAKGKVIIGGLGLAHQLIEVAKRRAVTEIVLVERSQELVEFLLPRAIKHCEGKKVSVAIGDAFEILPHLDGDVALLDIFPAYGENHAATVAIAKRCRKIKKVWGWGTSEPPRRSG
jgi:hypothetical protein